jgi:predicted ATP-grasp superfamily ATP-dependent carboligase
MKEFSMYDLIKYLEENKNENISLLELIIDYIEKNDLDLYEVAEKIKKEEQFKQLFYHDLVKHGEIYFEKGDGRIIRPKIKNIWE